MQKTENNSNLVWFRNDLRTIDNAVLTEACKNGNQVIGIYFFDPKYFEVNKYGFKITEKYRAKFLIETIQNLKVQLAALNIDLLVYHDLPETIIPKICDTYNCTNIYLQNDWTKDEVATENSVKSKLIDVNFHSIYNQLLYHPDDINFEISKTPQVFTVFRKKLEKYVSIREEEKVKKLSASNRIENNTEIPTLQDLGFEN